MKPRGVEEGPVQRRTILPLPHRVERAHRQRPRREGKEDPRRPESLRPEAERDRVGRDQERQKLSPRAPAAQEDGQRSLPGAAVTIEVPHVVHDQDRGRERSHGNRRQDRLGVDGPRLDVVGPEDGDKGALEAAVAGRAQGFASVREHRELHLREPER